MLMLGGDWTQEQLRDALLLSGRCCGHPLWHEFEGGRENSYCGVRWCDCDGLAPHWPDYAP